MISKGGHRHEGKSRDTETHRDIRDMGRYRDIGKGREVVNRKGIKYSQAG